MYIKYTSFKLFFNLRFYLYSYMYNLYMTYLSIKELLVSKEYKKDSIRSIMCGRRKPNADNRQEFEKLYGIPFDAWKNIQKWITEQTKITTFS